MHTRPQNVAGRVLGILLIFILEALQPAFLRAARKLTTRIGFLLQVIENERRREQGGATQ
jgi:hypothetical protein